MADPTVDATDDIHVPSENMITDIISNVTEDLNDDDNNVTDSITAAPNRGFEISISNKCRSILTGPAVDPRLNFKF